MYNSVLLVGVFFLLLLLVSIAPQMVRAILFFYFLLRRIVECVFVVLYAVRDFIKYVCVVVFSSLSLLSLCCVLIICFFCSCHQHRWKRHFSGSIYAMDCRQRNSQFFFIPLFPILVCFRHRLVKPNTNILSKSHCILSFA